MEEEKLERSIRKSEIPGLTREEEEAQLAKVVGIAEQNLEQAKADIRLANEDLADLMRIFRLMTVSVPLRKHVGNIMFLMN